MQVYLQFCFTVHMGVGIGNANPVKKSKIFELEAGAEAERSYPITEGDKKWKIIFLIKSMKLT